MADRRFAIIMEVPVRFLANLFLHTSNVLAEDIHHHGRLEQFNLWQRPVANGPVVDCKLGEVAGFNGVVTGIVRPRCQLVDVDFAVTANKHFHAEDPAQVDRVGNLNCHLLGLLLQFW